MEGIDDDPTEGLWDDSPVEKEKPKRRSQLKYTGSGRTVPNHLDAEQALIASCFHDESGEAFIRAQTEGVTAKDFYKPAHQVIWDGMLRLRGESIALTQVTIHKKLHDMGEVDAIGGASYMNEVLNQVETYAHIHHYIDIVIEMSTRRALLRSSQRLIENIGEGKTLEDLDPIIERMGKQIGRMDATGPELIELVSLTSFKRPAKDSPDRLLGKHRYICRGAGVLFVGSAGIGKTSATLQMAACWGCGKDFMGVSCVRPLRILIIQAEDDDGDVGEVWDSISYGMDLQHQDLKLIEENVKLVKDRVSTGAKFLKKLPYYIAAHNPDVVIINPLLSFLGGNISDQQVVTAFLRAGLNAINKDEKFAYILVHHTAKPEKSDGKFETNWSEYMYKMAGSHELTNWPRAIITLEAMKREGAFCLRFAKRGNRTGIMAKYGDPKMPNGTYFEPTNKITIKHTRAVRTLEGGDTAPMILWERIEECSDEYKELLEDTKVKPGPKPKIEAEEILTFVPVGADRGMDGGRLFTEVKKTYGIGQTQFYAHLRALRDSGSLRLNDKKQYYRD